ALKTDEAADNATVLDRDDGGQTADLVLLRESALLVHIDGLEGDAALGLRDGGERGFHLLTGAAPVRLELDDLERGGIGAERGGERRGESNEGKGEEEGTFVHGKWIPH